MTGRKPANPVIGQEALMLTWAELEVVPISEPGSVDLFVRSVHLINALNLRDEALELKRFVSRGLAKERYGQARADRISKTSSQKYDDAEVEFYRGYGLDAVLEMADTEEHVAIRKGARLAYKMFYSGYGNEEMRSTPERKRNKKLPQIREELGLLARKYTETSRMQTSEKIEVSATDSRVIEEQDEVLGLSPREKMEASKKDPRAGFIPTSRLEATYVATYLDYLDNPELFPLGPQNQLLEVANFQLKHHCTSTGLEYGIQAGRSIAHVFGDFYEQALQQLAQLRNVRELLLDGGNLPNQRMSLAIALHVDMLDAVPLLRYTDLEEYVATGDVGRSTAGVNMAITFDPVRTKTVREEVGSEKNKTVMDPYTNNSTASVREWLKKRMMKTTVKEGREKIDDAIADQQRRVMFHEAILEDFVMRKSDAPILLEAGVTAEQILNKIKHTAA